MCVDAPGINVTEATQTEMSANASETGDAPNIAPRDDWFLGCLINWANQFNLEQGITLAVGGAIISGQLISGRRYFEEMAAQAMAGTVTGTEDAESLKSTIADWYKQWTKIYDKPDDAPDDYLPPMPGFIHLRNAIWLHEGGKSTPSNGGVLWRGKLSSIDGFCLGETRPG